jgi:hypothetical protein
VETYKDFKNLVLQEFQEHSAGQAARSKLDRLRQGRHSVDAYNETFNKLSSDADYNETTLRHLYLKGLNDNISWQIMLMAEIPAKLSLLQDKATEFDLRHTYNFHGASTSLSPSDAAPRKDPINIKVERCFVELSDEERQRLRDNNQCFKCKKTGHIARFCCSNTNGGVRTGNRPYPG